MPRTIFLHGPQLIGDTYHPAGTVLDVEANRARSLVESGHASDFTRTDAHGSGTMAPLSLAEVAAVEPSPRRAARPPSKAARRLAARGLD